MSGGTATWRRGRGRHTGPAEFAYDELDPANRAFGTWPPVRPRDASDGRARVYIRGETPAGGDTVVLGGLTLFEDARPGGLRGSGGPAAPEGPGEPGGPDRPRPRWPRPPGWLLGLVAAVVVLVVAGYLGVPPLLTALGLGPRTGDPASQFPIPSSAAIAPTSGPGPVSSSPTPRPHRPMPSASAPASAPAGGAVPSASTTTASAPPPTLVVSYAATPSGGGFTGQVTVVNQGSAAVSGWQLVVALPGDTVSAVQNAEFTDDNDVLFMTPAPYDLSIAPGSSITVSIYGSGPEPDPAECSFNNVACR